MPRHLQIPELITALVAATFLWACTPEYTVSVTGSGRDRLDTLQSGGVNRTYEVHLPADYQTASPPVVVLFHQTGGNGTSLKSLTLFDLETNAYGFLAVYPNASSDWAYGCGCTHADSAGVDDVQFVADLIDELDADYGIDRDSVFVVGYAEGAFMAQKVACDATDAIAGLATVAATMSVPLAESCTPTGEIPVLMVHGMDDDEFPYLGALDRGLNSVLAADTALQFWATNNGCGDRLESVFVGTDSYFQFSVFREGFDACPANGDVVLLRMDEATHGWPNRDFNPSSQISLFFATGGCCVANAPEFLPQQ